MPARKRKESPAAASLVTRRFISLSGMLGVHHRAARSGLADWREPLLKAPPLTRPAPACSSQPASQRTSGRWTAYPTAAGSKRDRLRRNGRRLPLFLENT